MPGEGECRPFRRHKYVLPIRQLRSVERPSFFFSALPIRDGSLTVVERLEDGRSLLSGDNDFVCAASVALSTRRYLACPWKWPVSIFQEPL